MLDYRVIYDLNPEPCTPFEHLCVQLQQKIFDSVFILCRNRTREDAKFVEVFSQIITTKTQQVDPFIESPFVNTTYIEALFSYSERFWNMDIHGEIDAEEGFAAFLAKLLTSFEEFEKLKLFIKRLKFLPQELLPLLRRIKAGDNFLKSYNVTGLILLSKIEEDILDVSLKYWMEPVHFEMKSLNKKNWGNHFYELVMSCRFIQKYIQSLLPEETNINEFLSFCIENSRIGLPIMPLTYGISTYNLKIVITWFKSSSLLKEAATFVTFLHELCHCALRYQCKTPKEFEAIKTPQKNKGAEAGFDFEKFLFGDPLTFINEKAANYLISGSFPEDSEDFKKIFKKKNKSREINNISMARGGKFVELGKCAFKGLIFRMNN